MSIVHQRSNGLDFIRVTAISMVLVHHVSQMLNLPLREITNLGHFGVDLFFALSGYLIGGIYFKNPSLWDRDYLIFWGRRFLRTAPPYFVALFFSWISVYFLRGEEFNYRYLFFLQNYIDPMPFFLISWSLAIEEHFYILIFIFIFIGGKDKINLLLIISLFATIIFRFKSHGEWSFSFFTTATHLRLDALILGFYFSQFFMLKKYFDKLNIITVFLLIILFLVFCFFIQKNNNYYWFGYFVISLFSIIIIIISQNIEINNFLIKPFRYFSKITYSIYLTHALVLHFCLLIFSKLTITSKVIEIIFTLGVIFFTSHLFYIFIEKPSINFRDRIFPIPKKVF